MKNLTEDEIAEFIKTAYQMLTGYDKYKMMDFILDSPYRIEQNSGNTVLCGEGDKEMKYVQHNDPETRTTTISVLPYPPNEPLLREGEVTEGLSSAPEGY